MKIRMLSLTLVLASLSSTTSRATPPEGDTPAGDSVVATAERVIAQKLLRPLAAKENERSKFSRARMPAQERRVRVLDAALVPDATGAMFVAFAIDDRHGFLGDDDSAWSENALTGCVYPDKGEVFVVRGEQHRPAAMLLGKKTKAAPATTCAAAATAVRVPHEPATMTVTRAAAPPASTATHPLLSDLSVLGTKG